MSSPDRASTMQAPRGMGDQRGSILFLTVLAMLLLSVLALSFAMVGTLEGKIAVNHHALVRALYVAEAGIEGVKRELINSVNASGWTGSWTPVLQALGTVCNGANSVVFNITPTGGTGWTRTGARPTLFLRDNDTSLGVTWEDGNECVDTDGILTIRADGRVPAAGGFFGASQPVSVDVAWQVGGTEGSWDNAVNGGSGPPGAVINGNAMIYGGVALWDNGGGVVWDMGGTSGVRNNYQNGAGAPASEQMRASTRALLNAALLAQGDRSLSAGFSVQRGTVAFFGGATAGLPQGAITDRKQRLDRALATDFDPASIADIHADQTGPYSGSLRFPLLSDVVGGGDTRTWEVMLNQDGLVITPDMIRNACKPETPGFADCQQDVIDGYTGTLTGVPNQRRFCVYQNPPVGYVPPVPCLRDSLLPGLLPPSPSGVFSKFILTVDEGPNPNTATLEVAGVIVFRNFGTGQGLRIGGLKGGGPESLGEIVYSGSASIFVDDNQPANCVGASVCAGRLTIAADIKTAPGSYPTAVNPPVYPPAPGTVNTIGFMADRVGLGYGADGATTPGVGESPTHTGLFYAQTQLFMCKSTEVFGSLFSPIVTLSCQVPKIAAVKTMSRFLPRGLIGTQSLPTPGTLTVIRWREGAR